MTSRLRSVGLLAVLLLSFSLTVGAQNSPLDERTRGVASQLRCPVCQGVSIQDSPSELAVEMKSVVREQLAAGRTPDEVKAYFVEKYGDWVLLEPPATGFNLLVYVLPVLAVVGGVFAVVIAVRRWTTPTSAGPV